ncbi:MAG: aminodeoxychorismate lyase [Frankiales bacterium]|nr:aminodeoxychorismate lyase [Frankiales bacterium]
MSDLLDLGFGSAGERNSRNSRRGAVVVILAALVLIGALVAGFVLLKGVVGKPAITDYAGPGASSVTITIDPGTSVSEIGRLLVSNGVVATRQAFVDAAGDKTVVAGTYELKKEMKAADAFAYLTGAKHRLSLHVVVPEGFEADEVLKAIAKTGKITSEDLRVASRAVKSLQLPSYSGGHLEGFLFPATYDFEPGTTAAKALAAMVTRFKQAAKAVDLENGAAKLQRSPYEVLIIASIIEREAKNPDEYGKVARVIYNRLAKDMPLQMDSTLQYTLDVRKLHFSLDDIKDDTPYNSYEHKGLPPTPISNPGEASLRAALNPEPGAWLYFVSFTDGTTEFTDKYSDFVKLKARPDVVGKKK